MHYAYHTSDPLQDGENWRPFKVLYSTRLGPDTFAIQSGLDRITDLTPQEWQAANEWFSSEYAPFEGAAVTWESNPSVLEGMITHNRITYENEGGEYTAEYGEDRPVVKLDSDLSFAEMVEKAEAARLTDAQNHAAVALENKYGGDDLYAWQWEGISEDVIASYSAQDVIDAVQQHLKIVYDYQQPDWVCNAYWYGGGLEAFKSDSDYESALRAFLSKWQDCQQEYNPLYGLAL